MTPKPNQLPPTGEVLAGVANLYTRFGLPVIRLHYPKGDGTCSCGRPACWKGERPSAGKHPDMGAAWQKKATTDPATAKALFAGRTHANIGVSCTHASGLVMLDVDSEYGHELVGKLFGNLPPTPAFKTGRGVRYIFRNTSGVKLVERSEKNCDPVTGEELATEAFGVLVGDGVQTVMPPSLHYLGTRYEWLPRRSLEDLPIADAPPELIEYSAAEKEAEPAHGSDAGWDGDSPMADFNRRAGWQELYEAAEWKLCHKRADGVAYLTRPGKDGGVSATLGFAKACDGGPALCSFSGSVPYLLPKKAVDKFGFYARWKHGGEFSEAARHLRDVGFNGVRYGKQGPTANFGGSRAGRSASGPATSASPGIGQRQAPPAVPEYTPFPVACLPERAQSFVRRVAAATNTDTAFTGVYLLSLLSAMVGTTRAIMPKKGWRVFPGIWGCVVGRSSSGKTPPLVAISDALAPLLAEVEEENRVERASWEERKAAHLADPQRRGTPAPTEPQPSRLRVGDITIEALAGVLMGNRRGVWMMAEELSGWLASFTRYKSGRGESDRPKWLTLFDGGSLEVDRKTGEPKHLYIRNAMVAITGGIQPQILKAAMTEENMSSGLFARILLAYPPDRLAEWSEAEVDDITTSALTSLLRDLRRYTFGMKDGQSGPVLNTLHPAAKAKFVEFFNANRRHAFTADDAEAAATTKLESYALRFAHLRHLCRFAGGKDSDPVSAADMAAGIELAEWFRGELQRVRALLAEPERMQGQRRLVNWIRTRGGSVTVRELQLSNTRRYTDATAARVRLEHLAADGFGEWRDERADNGRAITRFTLHPDPLHNAQHCTTLLAEEGDEGAADLHNTSPGRIANGRPKPQGNQPSDREALCSVVRCAEVPEGGKTSPGNRDGSGEALRVSGEVLCRPDSMPSNPDEGEFTRLLRTAGVLWPQVVAWLNAGLCSADPYPPDTSFHEVILAHRQQAAGWLTEHQKGEGDAART